MYEYIMFWDEVSVKSRTPERKEESFTALDDKVAMSRMIGRQSERRTSPGDILSETFLDRSNFEIYRKIDPQSV